MATPLAQAEMLAGYARAVLVDAIMTRGGVPGAVYELNIRDLPGTLNTSSSHDMMLPGALRLLRRSGAAVPADEHVRIVAIEVQGLHAAAQAVPSALRQPA